MLFACSIGSIAIYQGMGIAKIGIVHGYRPDLGGVIRRAGCELLDIGGQKYSRDVVLVRRELGQRDELCVIIILKE